MRRNPFQRFLRDVPFGITEGEILFDKPRLFLCFGFFSLHLFRFVPAQSVQTEG